jgi:hypothetical protein
MEQLDYNLLFRWFVGMAKDDRIWMSPFSGLLRVSVSESLRREKRREPALS